MGKKTDDKKIKKRKYLRYKGLRRFFVGVTTLIVAIVFREQFEFSKCFILIGIMILIWGLMAYKEH
jgi:hypothetical protein